MKNAFNRILPFFFITGFILYWISIFILAMPPNVVKGFITDRAPRYNSLFGKDRTITIPYKDDFYRNTAHNSGLYFGASYASLQKLGQEKGYSLVYCSYSGNDLFFVRNDCFIRNIMSCPTVMKVNFFF